MDNDNLTDTARELSRWVLHPDNINDFAPYVISLCRVIGENLPVELKPCPAGHESVHISEAVGMNGTYKRVCCDDLNCAWAMHFPIDKPDDEVFVLWNRRTGDE